jgi:excisionase family DNA binding protein
MSDSLNAVELAPLPESTARRGIDPRDIGLVKAAYNVKEAVEATGLSRTTLYKDLKAGRLVAFRNGKTRLFLGRDLAAYMLELYRATRSKPSDEGGAAERGAVAAD